ncbi:aldehyde dehydrogenase [Rickenella mellea]|uniref:Aldehyde dehydrogenase n=1 Tax=Rickenella mellea TaxID=50990 RepID=A0A4R5XEP3_9AGAM|nr:aldehyde dehydrogenase [Rickenella mellea]
MTMSVRGLPSTLRRRYGPFAPGVRHEVLRSPSPNISLVEEIPVIDPATGQELCTVVSANAELVNSTIDHAHSTFKTGVWSRSSPHHRSSVLTNLANLLEKRVPEFARMEALQTGRTIREMTAQLGRLPEWLIYYSALLRTHQAFVTPTQGKLLNYVARIPLGVVAQITPFNHPLLIAVKKIAPALAAGNSVVVKPSELAPLSVLEFAEMAAEAGVPAGVLSVLPGKGTSTGKNIVSHPLIRKVDVTAGTDTGRQLGSIVGSNLASYTAELGGKAPIIVFNDADLKSAVNGAAFACFIASGQTCISGTRLIVQDAIYDEFVALFLKKIDSITCRIGDPLNPKSSMGALISTHHLERVSRMVEHTNGKVIVGGKRMKGISPLDGFDLSLGSFFAPTIVSDIPLNDALWREEVFGPVVVVKRFKTEAEGVDLANDSKYGLGAGIWTSDLSRAHRVAADIEAGLVWINTHHRNDPSSPWGGMKESGIGRENGVEAFEAYTQSKSTIVNVAPAEESRVIDDWFADAGDAKARYG